MDRIVHPHCYSDTLLWVDKMDLSREETDNFLSNILHLSDVRSRFAQDRRGLLDAITQSFSYSTTFHNLDILSTGRLDRKVPTLEDNKRFMLSGHGGLCWTMNSFFLALLAKIGYTVYPVAASVGKLDPEHKSHIVVIATNVVKQDDHYLIDVGFGSPTFCAIPFDFKDHSPSYKNSFQEFRYIWQNGIGIRQHRSHKVNIVSFTEGGGGWKNAYYFNLVPLDIAYFFTAMKPVYETQDDPKVPTSIFQISIRVVGFPNGKCIAIKDSTLLQEGDDHILHPTELQPHDDIVTALITHFPQFQESRPKVVAAVKEWARLS